MSLMYLAAGQPPPAPCCHPAGLPPALGREGRAARAFWHGVGHPSGRDGGVAGWLGEGCGGLGADLGCKVSEASLGCKGAHHLGVWTRRARVSGVPSWLPAPCTPHLCPSWVPGPRQPAAAWAEWQRAPSPLQGATSPKPCGQSSSMAWGSCGHQPRAGGWIPPAAEAGPRLPVGAEVPHNARAS